MQGMDLESLRRRQELYTVELRKEQRYQQARKRRILSQEMQVVESVPENPRGNDHWVTEQIRTKWPEIVHCTTNKERLELLLTALIRANSSEALAILICIRHSTCRRPRPLDELVSLGYIPVLLHLSSSEDYALAAEATWVVSNIASDKTQFTAAVVEAGGVDLYLNLAVRVPDLTVQEHVIWTLGNIAGDSVAHRNLLLDKGAHTALMQLLSTLQYPLHAKIYRTSTWTLSNLVRGKPTVPMHIYNSVLDTVYHLFTVKDKELKLNLYYIIETISGVLEAIDQIIARGFLPKIILSIRSQRKNVVLASLRIIGHIATGPEMHTDILLNFGLLDKLLEAMSSNESEIRKNCMWIVSNIAAGSRMQVNRLLESPVALLAVKAVEDFSDKVRNEASYFCYNLVKVGHSVHHRKLMDLGLISHLCPALHSNSPDAIANLLTVVDALLAIGESDASEIDEGLNPVLVTLQEYNCIEEIEKLRGHSNPVISRKAGEIIDKYLDKAVEEVEMTEAPAEFDFS